MMNPYIDKTQMTLSFQRRLFLGANENLMAWAPLHFSNVITQRERKILELRFPQSQPRLTLQEIGDSYFGLTRERVRQLESKAKNKLRRSSEYNLLLAFLTNHLDLHGYLTELNIEQISHKVICECGHSSRAAVLSLILGDSRILKDRIVNSSPAISIIRDTTVDAQVEILREEVIEAVDQNSNVTPLQIAHQLYCLHPSRKFRNWAIQAIISFFPIFLQHRQNILDDRRRNSTAPNLAWEVLHEEGKPLHWTEIGDRVNKIRNSLSMNPLSTRSIHERLTYFKDRFSYVDQGTYGLKEWGDDVLYIRQAINKILDLAGKPLSVSEITHGVAEFRQNVKQSSLNMYLGMHTDFYQARSGKYGLRSWLVPNPTISTSRDLVESPKSAERLQKKSNW